MEKVFPACLIICLCFSNIFAQTAQDSIYVFVGEQINVTLVENEIIKKPHPTDSTLITWRYSMDFHYKVKYRIIQQVFNHYPKDTIEFDAYDHYGKPQFAAYQHALLFVSEGEGGKLYHQKYQYFDVYLTTDGRWASPGDPYRFDDNRRGSIEAVKINFKEPVIFDLSDIPADKISLIYPQEYYRINGNKAIALKGVYVEDLMNIKKNGVLKARGIF